MEAEEITNEIYKQDNLPSSIPDYFIKNAFKTGQTKNGSNSWVIEFHPRAFYENRENLHSLEIIEY
jgi:hypothetical protein